MNQFTATATARADALQRKIELQMNQASIRYVFAPIFPMIVEPLSTTIDKGVITPISEQGQPVGEVYLQTLVRPGEVFDPAVYDVNQDHIGEITINPAPIVDTLLSQYGAQGAVQIKSLFNRDVNWFVGHDLNEIIFQGRQYETAAEYLEQFASVGREGWTPDFATLLGRVLVELEASVNVANAWARVKAEQSNQALKSGDIKHFSPFEAKLFKFSGVTPIDEAMNQVAVNQAALANSLPTIVTEFKEAVIAAQPDYTQLGAAIAQGVTAGMKDLLVNQNQPAQPAKEEAPKNSAPTKGGNKSA